MQPNLTQLFADRYTITSRKLGSGGHGTVYMAINQQTKRQLACKIVDFHTLMSSKEYAKDTSKGKSDINPDQMDIEANKNREGWMREVEILQSLDHVCCYNTLEVHC
jgi:serine/threonine protein kinase